MITKFNLKTTTDQDLLSWLKLEKQIVKYQQDKRLMMKVEIELENRGYKFHS